MYFIDSLLVAKTLTNIESLSFLRGEMKGDSTTKQSSHFKLKKINKNKILCMLLNITDRITRKLLFSHILLVLEQFPD